MCHGQIASIVTRCRACQSPYMPGPQQVAAREAGGKLEPGLCIKCSTLGKIRVESEGRRNRLRELLRAARRRIRGQ